MNGRQAPQPWLCRRHRRPRHRRSRRTDCIPAAAIPHRQITALLDHHARGDLGYLDSEDKSANDHAPRTGDGHLFFSYHPAEHVTIWIITNDILRLGGW